MAGITVSAQQIAEPRILVTVSTFNVTVTTVTCQWHAADRDRATAAIDADSDANSESLRPRIRVITVLDFTTLSHCNRFRVRVRGQCPRVPCRNGSRAESATLD